MGYGINCEKVVFVKNAIQKSLGVIGLTHMLIFDESWGIKVSDGGFGRICGISILPLILSSQNIIL